MGSVFCNCQPGSRCLAPQSLALCQPLTIPARVRRRVTTKDSASYRAYAHPERWKSSLRSSRIAFEQNLPAIPDDREDLRPPRFIPRQYDPGAGDSCSKDCGMGGCTRLPRHDARSLNPGLWYKRYPPIASRRQAKKREQSVSWIAEPALRDRKNQPLPGPHPLCTEFPGNWMWRKSTGPGFEVGDYEQDSEQRVCPSEDEI